MTLATFELTTDEHQHLTEAAEALVTLCYGGGLKVGIIEREIAADSAIVTRQWADDRDSDAWILCVNGATPERALAALMVDLAQRFAEYVA